MTGSQEESGAPTGRPTAGRTLVVALDGSPASVRALDLALSTASLTGSAVVAVYIIKRVTISGDLIGATAAMDQAAEELRGELEQLLQQRGREIAAGVPVRLEVRRGSVLKELVRVADDLDTRAVLVGASGHRLIGALAPKIVNVGRWPVTVVP